jgi:hypothetical protein
VVARRLMMLVDTGLRDQFVSALAEVWGCS